ncbi:MAG: hypothetical protein K8S94_09450 [Planctomycetia bacterium]|nr:hypothetical protein [Planctomycetia bacterium]
MSNQDATTLAPTPSACAPCTWRRHLDRMRPIVVAAWCLATTIGWQASAAPPARSRVGFFEGLIKKPEPTPPFIALPQPPSQDEVDRLVAERRAARPAKSAAKSTVQSQAKQGSPAKKPTVADAVAFGKSLQSAAGKVVDDAANPDYKPKPRSAVQPPQTAVVSPPPSARRQTLPLVVTRLQATGAPPPNTRRFQNLRSRIAQTLGVYQRRPLNTAQHTPWEVMHGFIAFGIPTQIRVGGPAGDLVSAIGWSNMGGRCRGQVMLAAADDRIVALKGIGVQGHSAQYLAILAQCRVAANSPLTVQGKAFTVADLIEEEKLSCKSKTELTFALIALAHYLPTDTTWKSRDGESWSLPRLVEEEIVQPIRGAPCGGTHRLFGLAYGCQRRLRATGQLDGPYLRADKYVRDYQNFALSKLQNRDGSFSTEWFKYHADREDDIDRKIQTTGHILEWLVSSLDQERLYEPRVVAAAEYLCGALASAPSREWKIGPLGHALHALNIYQERAWGVVLPGGIAAYNGSMKASAQPAMIAEQPEAGGGGGTSTRR